MLAGNGSVSGLPQIPMSLGSLGILTPLSACVCMHVCVRLEMLPCGSQVLISVQDMVAFPDVLMSVSAIFVPALWHKPMLSLLISL